MANTKNYKVQNESDSSESIVNGSDSMVKEKDRQIEELLKEIQILKSSLIINQIPSKEPDSETVVGYRMYTTGIFAPVSESIKYIFRYGEEHSILDSEIKECMKSPINNYKKLFADGVFYFKNESDYKKFGIPNHLDFDEKFIIEKLNNSEIPYLNEIGSGSKKNLNIFYVLLYRVAELYLDGKLKDWPHSNITKFEDYFGMRIDDAATYIKDIRNQF